MFPHLDGWIRNFPGFLGVAAVFGFVILIHELGHYLVARRVGIRCPRFAIGFGPRLLSFRRGGTEFSVRLLPFGGYVQMVGEDPGSGAGWHAALVENLPGLRFPARLPDLRAALDRRRSHLLDSREAGTALQERFREVAEYVQLLPDRVYQSVEELEGNFHHKSIPQRMAVIVGGVTMNFLAALVLFWIVGAVWGVGQLSPDYTPRVGVTLEGTPAAAAGLRFGDAIVAVAGEEMISGEDMIRAISRYPGEPVDLTVERGAAQRTLRITPEAQIGGMYFHPDSGTRIRRFLSLGRHVQSPAAEAGLREGDRLVEVDGRPVESFAELLEAFRELAREAEGEGKEKVTVTLRTDGMARPREVPFAASELEPAGKIGILPYQVLEIGFARRAVTEVVAVEPGSPAAEAGLRPGDRIYDVNGLRTPSQEKLEAVLGKLAVRGSAAEPLKFRVLRKGTGAISLRVPAGVGSTRELGVRLQPVDALYIFKDSLRWLQMLLAAPVILGVQLFQQTLTLEMVKTGSGGPVMIMQMIFELTDNGWGEFLFIVAVINAAIGAFNLIPFPALDGARLLFLGLGWLRGREFDVEKEAMVHYIGLMVLLAVVLLVTVLDVQRLVSGIPLTK